MPPWRTSISAAHTQRRVGGHARIAVRAAALQREHQLRGRNRLTLRTALLAIGSIVLHTRHAGLDRFARAADFLNGQRLEVVALGNAIGFLHTRDLEDLAAKSDQQNGGEIRVAGIAPLCARQHVESLALASHAAALPVWQRHNAVDIRIIIENAGAVDRVCDVIAPPWRNSSPMRECRYSYGFRPGHPRGGSH